MEIGKKKNQYCTLNVLLNFNFFLVTKIVLFVTLNSLGLFKIHPRVKD